MAITSTYLVASGKLETFLDAIRNAQAPERFTVKFLEDLGFKSTNDRKFLPLLKAVGMLDDNGIPRQRYYDFLDDSRWKRVLADGVREAYEDLFRVNVRAHNIAAKSLKGKLRSLTQGRYSEVVIGNMVRTFTELAKLADFETQAPVPEPTVLAEPDDRAASQYDVGSVSPDDDNGAARIPESPATSRNLLSSDRLIDAVTYRIELVLPAARDKAVYDAIFRSLKEHLL